MARGLLLWGNGPVRLVRQRLSDGAEVVAWPGSDTSALQGERLPFRRAEDVLGPSGLAALDAVPRAWARVWARLPLLEERSFRDLVRWRDESLLWAAEGFLRRSTAAPRCARTVELCLRLLDAIAPGELDAGGLAAADAALVARAATARGVLFHGEAGRPRPLAVSQPSPRGLRRWLAARPELPKTLGAGSDDGRLVLLLAADRALAGSLPPLLDALASDAWLRPVTLPLAALARFETRRVRLALREAERELRASHAALSGTAALTASYSYRGVGFADLAARDLEALLCERLPVAVRTIETAVELLASVRPALVLLAIEDRDERRALGLAARAAGVPWIVVRGATPEPDDPERADFGPLPAATLVLGHGRDPGEAVARVREAMRGSVGAR